MLVVVISGPIASGKSALSRVVAAQLEEAEEVATAVIDLDLVYETLYRDDARKAMPTSGQRLDAWPVG